MTSSSASIGTRPADPQSSMAPLWAGLLSAALLAALQAPPVLRPVAALAPVPLMLQRLRGGPGSTVLGAILAIASVGVVFPGWTTPVVGLGLLLPGLLMVEALARGRGFLRGCAWAFVASTVAVSIWLLALGPRMEIVLQELLQLTPQALAQFRAQAGEGLDEYVDQAVSWQQALAVIYPGVWFVLGGLSVVLNAVLLRAWLLRHDPGWLERGEFERLRLPVALTLPFVLAGGSLVFEPARRVGLNALIVVAFFFALQGLAIVAYYVQRLAGPALLRAGLAALVLLNPWATHLLVLLGLFDNWADFRKWADPPAETDA
jgi:uncharacterized protein YybS (DUF2232 family)